MSIKALVLTWSLEGDPRTSLSVDGVQYDLAHGARVAVVVDAALADPVVDIALGTALPLVLGDVGATQAEAASVAEWLDAINPDRLKQAVLQTPQGFEGLDPVSQTLKILRQWARL